MSETDATTVVIDGVMLDLHDLAAYYRTAKLNWDTCLKERDLYREAFAILANDRGLTVDEAMRMLLEQQVVTNDGDRWDSPRLRELAKALGMEVAE